MKPDLTLLSKLPIRRLIVTAKTKTEPYDFVSRFFAPRAGINEDPVTGSAHSVLGPFWQSKLHKSELLAYQASRRGGVIRVRVGDRRVFIGGKAVTVFKAELNSKDADLSNLLRLERFLVNYIVGMGKTDEENGLNVWCFIECIRGQWLQRFLRLSQSGIHKRRY